MDLAIGSLENQARDESVQMRNLPRRGNRGFACLVFADPVALSGLRLTFSALTQGLPPLAIDVRRSAAIVADSFAYMDTVRSKKPVQNLGVYSP